MSKKQRNILIGIGIFFLIGFIGSFFPDEQEKPAAEPTTSETQTTEQPAPTDPVVEEPMPEPAVKITDIIRKSESEVAVVLGQPDSREEERWHYADSEDYVSNCFKCSYKNGLVEVFYIEGVAARITVNVTDMDYENDAAIMNSLGLPTDRIYVSGSNFSKVWQGVEGIYEITAFNNRDTDKVNYIYIITDEMYE